MTQNKEQAEREFLQAARDWMDIEVGALAVWGKNQYNNDRNQKLRAAYDKLLEAERPKTVIEQVREAMDTILQDGRIGKCWVPAMKAHLNIIEEREARK